MVQEQEPGRADNVVVVAAAVVAAVVVVADVGQAARVAAAADLGRASCIEEAKGCAQSAALFIWKLAASGEQSRDRCIANGQDAKPGNSLGRMLPCTCILGAARAIRREDT